MVATFGGMIGGVGLLFFGMWLLSENIKTVAGPRIRILASRLTSNRFAGFGCGMLAGAITQSSVAVTSITVSMLKSELISTRQGFLVVIGAQLGVALLILVVAFDVKLVALYALGLAGIIIFRTRKIHYRETGAMLFGVAALVFGLILIKESAAPLVEQSWFHGALEISTRSLILSLVIGAILTFIVQAGLPVIAFGIVMASAGLVEFEQILMFVYGVYIGLGFCILVVAINLNGTARQIAMFSVIQTLFPAVILVPLLYVELYLGVPLVKAAVLSLDIGLASEIALIVILYGTPSRIVALAAPDWTVRAFSRFWPAHEMEEMSRPKYIHDRALDDAETAIDLAHLEQKRVVGMFSGYLEMARTGNALGVIRLSTRGLIARLDEFLVELELRHPGSSIERRNSVLSQQKLIAWLEEQFSDLCESLREMPEGESLHDFRSSLIEGTDGAFLVFLDALESDDADSWSFAEQLMGDRRVLMQEVRARFLQAEPESGSSRQSGIVKGTNSVENIFFLLAQLTREFHGSRAAPTAVVSQTQ